MIASDDQSDENKPMPFSIQEAYQKAKSYFAKPRLRPEEIQTKKDFFELAGTILDDERYEALMACKGEENCMGFVDMWTSIFATSKEEAQRVAGIIGLEPPTSEITGMLEDKILASFTEPPDAEHQR